MMESQWSKAIGQKESPRTLESICLSDQEVRQRALSVIQTDPEGWNIEMLAKGKILGLPKTISFHGHDYAILCERDANDTAVFSNDHVGSLSSIFFAQRIHSVDFESVALEKNVDTEDMIAIKIVPIPNDALTEEESSYTAKETLRVLREITTLQLNHRPLEARVLSGQKKFLLLEIPAYFGSNIQQLISESSTWPKEELFSPQYLRTVMQLFYTQIRELRALEIAGWRHKDIKPANIIAQVDGTARLVDFGLAQPITDDEYSGRGTPLYMLPDEANQGLNKHADRDIYASALMYLELLGFIHFDIKAFNYDVGGIIVDPALTAEQDSKANHDFYINIPSAVDREFITLLYSIIKPALEHQAIDMTYQEIMQRMNIIIAQHDQAQYGGHTVSERILAMDNPFSQRAAGERALQHIDSMFMNNKNLQHFESEDKNYLETLRMEARKYQRSGDYTASLALVRYTRELIRDCEQMSQYDIEEHIDPKHIVQQAHLNLPNSQRFAQGRQAA